MRGVPKSRARQENELERWRWLTGQVRERKAGGKWGQGWRITQEEQNHAYPRLIPPEVSVEVPLDSILYVEDVGITSKHLLWQCGIDLDHIQIFSIPWPTFKSWLKQRFCVCFLYHNWVSFSETRFIWAHTSGSQGCGTTSSDNRIPRQCQKLHDKGDRDSHLSPLVSPSSDEATKIQGAIP